MKTLSVTRRLVLATGFAFGTLAVASSAFAQQKVLTVGSAFVPSRIPQRKLFPSRARKRCAASEPDALRGLGR